MRIISFIDDSEIIKKILNHLGLWEVGRKPPARANSPPTESFIIYDECSSPSADDPPSISSARQVPPLVLPPRSDRYASGLITSARQVT